MIYLSEPTTYNEKLKNTPKKSGFFITKKNYDKDKNEPEGDTDLEANFVVVNRSEKLVKVNDRKHTPLESQGSWLSRSRCRYSNNQ